MTFVHRFVIGFLVFALMQPPLRADDLPELGDVASEELSLATEKKIGQQIMNEIRWREPAYLDDPDVEAYLNQLGARLVAVSNDPGLGYYFFPLNDPSINAFAMPGGYIGVHTGLILSAQSESELAGVLAHEISHVTQRHIARQIYQSKQINMASMLAMGLTLLAARSNSQVAGAAIAGAQAGVMSSQLAFSRDFERESDRMGFEILRKAGFDVGGMAAFFERLQKLVRLYENNAIAYLRTHPLTSERLSDMQNREQTVSYRQVADSQDFLLIRAKLRAMQGTPMEAVHDFQRLLEDKKFASEGAANFGLAIALGRMRQWAEAETVLRRAQNFGMASAIFERQMAEVQLAQGASDQAMVLYSEAMVRYPFNQALLYGYTRALLKQRRFDEALRFIELKLQNTPQDLRLHKMRAESYAGLGRNAQQHLALAEVFSLQGQTEGAIDQLQHARNAGDANFYELSVIDARMRELRRRRLEEQKEKRN